MKRLAVLLCVVILLCAGGSAGARTRAGCVVELNVYGPYRAELSDVPVMVDGEMHVAPVILAFPVNPTWTHVIALGTDGALWSTGVRCVNPAVIPLEVYLP